MDQGFVLLVSASIFCVGTVGFGPPAKSTKVYLSLDMEIHWLWLLTIPKAEKQESLAP